MTVELINLRDVRQQVDNQIKDYEQRLSDASLSSADYRALLSQLIDERKMFLAEYDELNARNSLILPAMLRQHSGFNLLLSDIDENLFNDFQSLSDKVGLPPGEILSHLMREALHSPDASSSAKDLSSLINHGLPDFTVSGQDSLVVSGDDLVKSNFRMAFKHIDTLEFVNISPDMFQKFVSKITNCQLVRLPSSIPKLLVYSKLRNCDNILFYEADVLDYASTAQNVVEQWKNGDEEE